MKKNMIIFFIKVNGLLFVGSESFSKTIDESVKTSKDGFYLVPVFFYLPNTSYAIGDAFIYYNYPTPYNLKRSQDIVYGYGTYSTKKQMQTCVRINRFYGDNNYRFDPEVSHYYSPYEFLGIVPDLVTKVKEDVIYNKCRIKIDFLFSKINNIYIGTYFWSEKFEHADDDSNCVIVKGDLLGSLAVTTSSLGWEVIYVLRASLFCPTEEIFADMSKLYFNKLAGVDVNFLRFDLYVRYNIGITKQQVLALNTLIGSAASYVPIQMLLKLGNHQMMRGYLLGKYLDKTYGLFMQNTEDPYYEELVHLHPLVSVRFCQRFPESNLNDFKIAGGIGLRYLLDREQHLNLAQPQEGADFYFTIQEVV